MCRDALHSRTASILVSLFLTPFTCELTLLGGDLGPSCSHELDVSQLQDSRQQLKHVSDLLLRELQHLQSLLRRDKQQGKEIRWVKCV